MELTLGRIHACPNMELRIIASGMHLSKTHGRTIRDILRSGLPVAARVPFLKAADDGASQAKGLAGALSGFVDALRHLAPSIVLLLGDRGEMLAAAIAAAHLNIPMAHLHGGEVSGTLDESFRHCITKLAHLHLPATSSSAERIRRMGEPPARIKIVGAPGLDAALSAVLAPSAPTAARWGLNPAHPYLLVVQHPVHQTYRSSAAEMRETLLAVRGSRLQALVIGPNSDAGHRAIAREVGKSRAAGIVFRPSIPRGDYLSLLDGAAAIVGNSSSGIIESASFGTPCVNVGPRQAGRERNPNVLDAPHSAHAISRALRRCLSDRGFLSIVRRRRNLYGDGHAGPRIVSALRTMPLGAAVLMKRFFE